MPERDDEITLLALAGRAGDRDATTEFIRATQRDVQRFLLHLADPGDVEDLAQETYLRAMRALPQFTARSSAKTWLFAIARRVAADQVRANQRRPRTTALSDDWAQTDRRGQEIGPAPDEVVALRQLMAQLPTQQREAFVATQVLGLSYAEAAQVCDCPVGTIRSRVARAREELVTVLRAASGARPQTRAS